MNKKLDLFWIIPEILGELFFYAFVPLVMVKSLSEVGVLSVDGMLRMSITLILFTQMSFKGVKELLDIHWKKEVIKNG